MKKRTKPTPRQREKINRKRVAKNKLNAGAQLRQGHRPSAAHNGRDRPARPDPSRPIALPRDHRPAGWLPGDRTAAEIGQATLPAGTSLLKYDAACHALAEAKSFDEVRDWEDKAAAIREYSRRARNRMLELDAIEIRERARRRRGELLIELKSTGQLAEGRKKLSEADDSFRLTLDQIDVTPDESSRDQKIAALDAEAFERNLASARSYAEEHPEKHTFNVLQAPGQPVNGSRSIMSSRQEPDDSLDYFPTPPWATRALVECVLRGRLGCDLRSAWEPACGEGHIAEVLREYCADVYVSDVHDYGTDAQLLDFLAEPFQPEAFDWIITNPPFNDKTEAFVLRALDLARVGVAMFVRLQWLESVGRYENVFRDHPPTLIAFFAERVNLCKGRWDPAGTTATAYIWLVWIKDHRPLPPFWIPPGQRENLTLADDAERFTAHPVIKKTHEPSPCAVALQPPVAPADADLDIPSFLRRDAPDRQFRSSLS